ncbi:MAG: thiamine-phosphate synthase family protein [Candidatus Thorarchaeota archaeon]|jgi:predicted fused transcriptional regulator/phosphomethylpyrimidine kinase/predicted transcriptional regulator
MRPPCELVQREFLPAVRSRLAKRLSEEGQSQTEIADVMEITQAAVSKYLSQHSSTSIPEETLDSLVSVLAKGILSTPIRRDRLVKEVCSACMSLRIGSHVCVLHQERVPSLKQVRCQICSELLGGADVNLVGRATVLQDLMDAIGFIETISGFDRVIPQVRANLVACDEAANTVSEVAGFPGRILLIEGQARAHANPQFGASRHTARLLLWAKHRYRRVRACLCLSGGYRIVKAAKSVGFKITELAEASTDVEFIIRAMEEVKTRQRATPKYPAIHVPGGIGVEPILYLFGSSASDLGFQCGKIVDKT